MMNLLNADLLDLKEKNSISKEDNLEDLAWRSLEKNSILKEDNLEDLAWRSLDRCTLA